METHVKVLGALHMIFGGLGILFGLLGGVFFGSIAGLVGMTSGDPDAAVAAPILGAVGGFLMIFALIVSIPGVILGYGLVKFRPWARPLGIVISALELLMFPFGTALGVYGLWVLLTNEGAALFTGRAVTHVPPPAM